MSNGTNWRRSTFAKKATMLAAGLAASAMATAPAGAQAQTLVGCDVSVHVALTRHSLTMWDIMHRRPRETEFAADRRGTASCVGQIAGRRVKGIGTAVIDGEFVADPLCLSGIGAGSVQISTLKSGYLATLRDTLEGTFNLDVAGLVWRGVGHLADSRGASTSFSGLLRFTPDDGADCAADTGTVTGHLAVGGGYAHGPTRPPSGGDSKAAAPSAQPAAAPAKKRRATSRKARRCKAARKTHRGASRSSRKAKRHVCIRRSKQRRRA